MKSFCVLLAGVLLTAIVSTAAGAADQDRNDSTEKVFQLRIYHVAPGKMEALKARFRDHTNALFKKHGITIIGFWTPTDPREAEKRLIYVISVPSKEAAAASFKAFGADPEWLAVREASEKDGRLVEKVDATFMKATNVSPIK